MDDPTPTGEAKAPVPDHGRTVEARDLDRAISRVEAIIADAVAGHSPMDDADVDALRHVLRVLATPPADRAAVEADPAGVAGALDAFGEVMWRVGRNTLSDEPIPVAPGAVPTARAAVLALVDRMVADREREAHARALEAHGSMLLDAERALAAATRRGEEAERAGAVGLIAAERARQQTAEGWDTGHDDEHDQGELAAAAASYAAPYRGIVPEVPPATWPWGRRWWKPTPDDRVRELVKAGALIVAEIERLQRAARPSAPPPPPEVRDA
jgi:hypothetical protein